MNRYVVLEHDWPETHWDFMIEWGGTLRTWKLHRPPDSGGAIPAQPLGDHRTMYLDYEGPLSGDRGHVVRWDRGTYELVSETTEGVVVELRGERLEGCVEVVRDPASGTWHASYRVAE